MNNTGENMPYTDNGTPLNVFFGRLSKKDGDTHTVAMVDAREVWDFINCGSYPYRGNPKNAAPHLNNYERWLLDALHALCFKDGIDMNLLAEYHADGEPAVSRCWLPLHSACELAFNHSYHAGLDMLKQLIRLESAINFSGKTTVNFRLL